MRAQALLSDQCQSFRRRCNDGRLNPSLLKKSPERRAHGRLVLDRENAAREGIIVRMHRRRCFRHLDTGLTARTLNEKPCTRARNRAYLDPVIQDFSQPLHDRKAQPKAAPLRGVGPLIVLLEYMRQLVFGDTDATVPDFNANIIAGSPTSKQDSSPVSVTDRIRQQVADHLLKHAPVASDDELGTDDAQRE